MLFQWLCLILLRSSSLFQFLVPFSLAYTRTICKFVRLCLVHDDVVLPNQRLEILTSSRTARNMSISESSTLTPCTKHLSDSCPGNGVTHDKCTTADFATSTINNPIAIAAFLSDICPNMVAIKTLWSEHPAMPEDNIQDTELHQERWNKVERLVPAFAAVRRQCLE
jgi:hypothetical protein